MATAVTFRSAWTFLGIYFVMDMLAYILRDYLPAWIGDFSGNIERDLAIAWFLLGLWLFCRFTQPATKEAGER